MDQVTEQKKNGIYSFDYIHRMLCAASTQAKPSKYFPFFRNLNVMSFHYSISFFLPSIWSSATYKVNYYFVTRQFSTQHHLMSVPSLEISRRDKWHQPSTKKADGPFFMVLQMLLHAQVT